MIGFEVGGPGLALVLAGIGATLGYFLAWALGQFIENYLDKGIEYLFGYRGD
jgi:membrane protein YqaA with SNARE-associated domain